jgi:transcriptional regulator with XRE-family HTH domain
MSDFSQRLHETIEFNGLLQKELAAKAGIKKRALDMYLGSRQCMPPADVAVKIASTLGVTVEYLVTGEARPENDAVLKYVKYRDIIDELPYLPENTLKGLKDIVKTIASQERERRKSACKGV